jgi:hypothetical protein
MKEAQQSWKKFVTKVRPSCPVFGAWVTAVWWRQWWAAGGFDDKQQTGGVDFGTLRTVCPAVMRCAVLTSMYVCVTCTSNAFPLLSLCRVGCEAARQRHREEQPVRQQRGGGRQGRRRQQRQEDD